MAKENIDTAAFDTGSISPEELVKALALVGDFVKGHQKEALQIVKASLAAKSKNDNRA